MKKFLFHFAAVAVVATTLLATSCTKDEGNIYRLKIHQYTSADKTSLGDGGVTLWSTGDEVYVNGTTTVQISDNVSDYVTSIEESLPIDGRLYCFYAGNATMTGFDATTKTFTYTMPDRFGYDPNKLKAPMVGANDGNVVDFENICTMLKLEFPTVMPTTIEITSASTAISGEFSVSYGANGWEVHGPATVTEANRKIVVTNSTTDLGTAIYVPLPAGSHKLTIKGKYFTKAMNDEHQLAMNTIYPITCAHAFSVSQDKQVYFAPGNLLRKNIGSDRNPNLIVCFTDGQNTMYQANGSSAETGMNYTHDLWFPSSSTLSTSFPKIPEDLTTLTINGKNDWQILTQAEWTYVINTRDRTKRFLGTANRIPGLFILPDDFQNTTGISLPVEAYTANTSSTNFNSISLSSNDWSKLEALGVVFLPAAKFVSYTYGNHNLGSLTGGYYGSTSSNGLAFYKPNNNNTHTINTNYSLSAMAVSYRLVRNAN